MKISESVKKGLTQESDIPNLKLPDSVIDFFKSGGNLKMKSKKGNKIHIKKENRGKFTDYCGGTVTSECIARGKRSSSPTIRKRATFAANARKWKHQFGGPIYSQEDVDAINNSNRNTAKGLFKGIVSGKIMPTMENLGNMLGAAYNGYLNPKTTAMTGEPTILPGKVNMSLYKDAKNLLKGPQYDEKFVNFVDRLAKGKINPRFITKNNTVSPANYNYVDLTSESIPKGFVKGNEITVGQVKQPLEGLSIRTVTNPTQVNYVENAAEQAARSDFLSMIPKEKKFKEVRQIAGSNKNIPGVRVVEDWSYPISILKKYKLGRYKETSEVAPAQKIVSSKSKITQQERYKENKPISKRQRVKANQEDYYQYSDGRSVFAGNRRMPRLQQEESINMMKQDPRYLKSLTGIQKRLAKLTKGTPAYNQAKKDLKNLVEDFDINVRKIKK